MLPQRPHLRRLNDAERPPPTEPGGCRALAFSETNMAFGQHYMTAYGELTKPSERLGRSTASKGPTHASR